MQINEGPFEWDHLESNKHIKLNDKRSITNSKQKNNELHVKQKKFPAAK